ncbi:MAG: hypothetical protein HRU11_12640, partial [Parvularculaceae bacterium]|nr:hypothetical protein [Parvularculaceae bacterium]
MPNSYIALEGGLDLVTPELEVSPGTLIKSENVFEAVKGGYSTVEGFERFNGEVYPSSEPYTVVEITDFSQAAGAQPIDFFNVVDIDGLVGTIATYEERPADDEL